MNWGESFFTVAGLETVRLDCSGSVASDFGRRCAKSINLQA
jgi:hypothetical protein